MQRQPGSMASTVVHRLAPSCSLQAHALHLRPTGINLRYSSTFVPRSDATFSKLPFVQARRTLSTSAAARHSPSLPVQSTALLEKVKQSEIEKEPGDAVGQKLQEGGKGTEGAHYKGKQNPACGLDYVDVPLMSMQLPAHRLSRNLDGV